MQFFHNLYKRFTTEPPLDSVRAFHETFGMPVASSFDPLLFENHKLIKLRIDLIEEELQELKDAIDQKDRKEVIDALADILYVTYGAGVSLGIDLTEAFRLVHVSNMSKADLTEEDAKKSVQAYQDDPRYDSPAYKKVGSRYVIFNKSTGKTLKSLRYGPVDLSPLL